MATKKPTKSAAFESAVAIDANANDHDMELCRKVDRLGELNARMADLKTESDAIKAELIDAGITPLEGLLFRVTISTSTRTTTDYKGICEKLKPSRQLLAAYTKESEPITTVRVAARTGK